jgi:hypothetical protein
MFLLRFTLGIVLLFFHGATAPNWPRPPHYLGFTIALRHTTHSRTPLDEWSARRRNLYLTAHNTHKKQTFISPAGFEPTIPAIERQQTQALDRTVAGIGCFFYVREINMLNRLWKNHGRTRTLLEVISALHSVNNSLCYRNKVAYLGVIFRPLNRTSNRFLKSLQDCFLDSFLRSAPHS